jgi:polygalacturonase
MLPTTLQRRQLLKLSPLALLAAAGTFPEALGQTSLHETKATFNVRDFGAVGDGKTVDTPAINKAIEEVAAFGGGMVLFPAGTYICFTIHLRSNVDLYLSAGCILQAADSPRKNEMSGYRGGMYDAAEPNDPWTPYQDYGHNHWRNSLFYAEDQHNFSVLGLGLIFGKGLSHGLGDSRGGYEPYVAEQPGVGNKAFALKNCQNVLLRDFTILKGGHFAVLATGVDNLVLDHLMIDSDRDGFDIDSCRNVRVSNCTVNTPWDDAICLKSSYALGYARSTDNVTISNNFVSGYYELGTVASAKWQKFADAATVPRNGRIKFGTESNGGFRNITVSGNVLEGCKGFALESSDGAFLEDVAITCNTLRDIADCPLFLRLNRRNRNPKETLRPGTLRRIIISDLVSSNSNASTASIFSGIPSNMIEDVKISNCYFGHRGLPPEMPVGWGSTTAKMPDWHRIQVPEKEDAYPEPLKMGPTPCHGFFIRHLRNLEMSHVEIAPAQPDPRPAFWLGDVHRADLFAITAPAQSNFSLHNISDLRIAWSRATPDINLAKVDDRTL